MKQNIISQLTIHARKHLKQSGEAWQNIMVGEQEYYLHLEDWDNRGTYNGEAYLIFAGQILDSPCEFSIELSEREIEQYWVNDKETSSNKTLG